MAAGPKLGTGNLFKHQMVDLFGIILLKFVGRGQCFLCSKDFVLKEINFIIDLLCVVPEGEESCKYCLFTPLFQIGEDVIILSSLQFSANIKNVE